MSQDPVLYLTFLTGLMGGFGHCIGMCGPLAASLAIAVQGDNRSVAERMGSHFLYHVGRIATYACIGAIMGFSGSFAETASRMEGMQSIVLVSTGFAMVAAGVRIARGAAGMAWLERHNLAVLKAAKALLQQRTSLQPLLVGAVLGLLPCGLSYTVFIAAAGAGGALSGMLMAILFGIGTMPALLIVGAAVVSGAVLLRTAFYRMGGLLVAAMGALYLYRGIRAYAGL